MGLARCGVWAGGKGIVKSMVNVKACLFRRYEKGKGDAMEGIIILNESCTHTCADYEVERHRDPFSRNALEH
jgi:hypothetical protein